MTLFIKILLGIAFVTLVIMPTPLWMCFIAGLLIGFLLIWLEGGDL